METDLTKRIKQLTHSYKPQMSTGNVGRTIRYADEVWTPTGIVDSIRFEDYISDVHEGCKLIDYKLYAEDYIRTIIKGRDYTLGQCKCGGTEFPRKDCKGCFYKVKDIHEVGILTTCYEVKITKADFKSNNGHNFHGNENYYCVPKELVPQIQDMVPEDVGILAYHDGLKSDGLRLVKKSARKEIDDHLLAILLYNAMKKWCDWKQ